MLWLPKTQAQWNSLDKSSIIKHDIRRLAIVSKLAELDTVDLRLVLMSTTERY